MSASTKLSNAVKALCYLAEVHPEPKTSIEISEKVGVNASKLRKLLSLLSKEDIVSSIKGVKGGFLLERSPDNLHIQEIYCGIEDRKAFHMDVNTDNDKNLNRAREVNQYFIGLFSEIQLDIEEKMKAIKLQDVIDQITQKKNIEIQTFL